MRVRLHAPSGYLPYGRIGPLAAIRATRHSLRMKSTEYRFDRFRLLPAARELWLDDRLLTLTRPVFDCIAYLVEHRDRAVGRDELVAALWGRVDLSEARVNELVLRARRTVGDDGQLQRVIRTVPGFGYRWVIQTEAMPARQSGADAAADHGETAATTEVGPRGGAPNAQNATVGPAPAYPIEPKRSRSPRTWALLLGLALALAVGVGHLQRGAFITTPTSVPTAATPAALVPDAMAVLPLAVNAPPEAGWVRLGAMDLIADRLRSAGLPIPPSENVLLALHGSGEEHDGDRARLETALGARQVVEGTAVRSADGWKVRLETAVAGIRHRVEADDKDVTEAARRSADLLLAALGRTPPERGHEGAAIEERLQQAQAALLASELDTARAILEGRPESARDDPRARYRLAMIDFRSGRFEQAEAVLNALASDPAVRADALLRGRVLIVRGKMSFRLDRYAAAEQDLDTALESLQGLDAALDIGIALTTRGASRIGLGKLDAAAADLGQARIRLQEAGDRLGIAQVDTNVGLLEMERGRLERALAALLDAADRFEAAGVIERAIAVRTAVVQAQILSLQWTDALATADRQALMRDRSGDAGLNVQVDIDRAKALLGLGRFVEARATLDQMEQRHHGQSLDVAHYRDAVVAELAWREGRVQDAATAADRALAHWPDNPNDDLRARAVLLQQRIRYAQGSSGGADDAGDTNSVALLVARAERAQHENRLEDAAQAWRTALAKAENLGFPADIALVAQSYGPWLLTRNRIEEAEALAGRVAPWAKHDFDCALLQVRVMHARDRREAWTDALRRAQALAGERRIAASLLDPPFTETEPSIPRQPRFGRQ